MPNRPAPHAHPPVRNIEALCPGKQENENRVRCHHAENKRSSQVTTFRDRPFHDWLRVEYGIPKPSNKLLILAELDSNTWVSEEKRIRGKKQPLITAGFHALRDEYTHSIEPSRALVAETLKLERTLSDLVNQAYALTPAEIDLMWQTAPPRMPISPLATLQGSVPESRRTEEQNQTPSRRT